MKRYSLIVLLHLLCIALFAVGTYVLAQEGLWFSALMLLLLLVLTSFHLYRMQMVQLRLMRQLMESLRRDDLMLSFRSPYRNRMMQAMVNELSDAMREFRTRSLERNEMESWQKLIRVLTHEIMNSITPIISLSDTLSEREVNADNYPLMQQGMQTIHRRSEGLLEFVQNYRKLTRLPAPNRQPVSLVELLKEMQQLFNEEYIHISLPQEDRILLIDRVQIEQVLINLIKNAKEACGSCSGKEAGIEGKEAGTERKEPRVEVSAYYPNSRRCSITVMDNGCGILPEALDKIFVPFFTTKPSGSGIGLSLCKQIMNRHGGNITVQSVVGEGSRFTLSF